MQDLTIEILSQESEKILKTLPVAHYLKVDTIPVIFDNYSQTSYFNPNGFEIHIALVNIAEAIVGSGKEELTNADLEKHIRCFLYHEISHAILTPRRLMQRAQSGFTLLNPNFANILEDERIETILKNYYHGVDFKQNLHNAIPLQHAKTFENFVFNAVRFRYAPIMKKEINQKVNQFIQITSKINSTTSEETSLCRAMENLLKYLKGIWDKLVQMAKSQSDSQQSNSSSNEEESSSSTEEKTQSNSKKSSQSESEDTNESKENSSKEDSSAKGDSSNEESEESEEESDNSSKEESEDKNEEHNEDSSKEESTGNEENAEDPSQSEDDDPTAIIADDFEEESADSKLSNEEIEETMKNAVVLLKQESAKCWNGYSMKLKDYESDNNTKVELLKVIVRNVGTGINQSQAQYGYCGRFNAKRFMKDHNDSCKWFEKKAYEDNQTSKKSSKKILNIWLDQSGSFEKNNNEVNKILKALYEIEQKRNDFEWNLIRVDSHFVIERNKERRFSKSSGSNALPKEEIEKCYHELNKSGYEYNIILFDGKVGENIDEYFERVANEERRVMSSSSYDENYKKRYHENCEQSRKNLEMQRCKYDYKNLKVFDNKRSIFISEYSNTADIKRVCKNAKAVIEENCNYAGTLAKNVIKALDLLF